ncbi:MAG: hypothetical protein Q7R56_01405 [Nanoarchaeota archaeon]|nr:hypothetical protein [Nanoarchaeota archaeon]
MEKEKTETIKQAYQKIAKKHDLPNWEAINEEFEISVIELEDLSVLKQVRRKIADKCNQFASILESFIQPNPGSFINLEETKFFNEEEIRIIYDLLKEFMYLERRSLSLDVLHNEAEDVRYINDSFQLWKKVKKDLEKFTLTLKEGWKKELKTTKYHYFG